MANRRLSLTSLLRSLAPQPPIVVQLNPTVVIPGDGHLIIGISHLAVRTRDLASTTAFYARVLGLQEVERPKSMDFPGTWIAVPTEVGSAILHVYAGAAAGLDGTTHIGNDQGMIDHLALDARGFHTLRERFRQFGLSWREQHREGRSVWQLFVHDPNGIKIELSFLLGDDAELPASIDEQRLFNPAERFFDPTEYGGLMVA